MKFRWKRRVVPCLKCRYNPKTGNYPTYRGYNCYRRFDLDDYSESFDIEEYKETIESTKENFKEYEPNKKLGPKDYLFTYGW